MIVVKTSSISLDMSKQSNTHLLNQVTPHASDSTWGDFDGDLNHLQIISAAKDDESPDHSDDEGHLGLALADPELEEPRLFKVVLLNDDYTPMDFVVEVLMKFFSLDHDRATQVMLHVHTRGKGVCGVFSYQIAETKAVLVNDYSRENQHPLQCSVESA